jgi:hypothetical protein
MTGPVRPVGPAQPRGPQRRTGDRRQGDERRDGEPRPARALVPSDEPPAQAPDRQQTAPPTPVQPSAFAAQMIGQTGAKKGLKGGPPVLDAARGSYLGTEYSGAGERRPKPGKTRRTDI